jgi:hypothetical protein
LLQKAGCNRATKLNEISAKEENFDVRPTTDYDFGFAANWCHVLLGSDH